MARFLFTMWTFPGNLNPSLAIAETLRSRGHEVAFYTGNRAAGTLEALHFRHFPMVHVDEDQLYAHLFFDGTAHARRSSLLRGRAFLASLRAFLLATVPGQLSDLEPIVTTWQPDTIVCDYTLWAPFLVLHEAYRVPVAVLSLAAGCMVSGPDAPLWGRALPPPRTRLQRMRNQIERAVGHVVTRSFREEAGTIRARYGLPRLTTSVIDFAATMPLYLVTSVPALDYDRSDLPSSVHYIGSCAWGRHGEADTSWLDDLPQSTPLVYATEGTLQVGQPRLLQATVQGLGGLPVQVLIKDAQILEPAREHAAVGLDRLPANVRVERYAVGAGWYTRVLARAAVVVTNAGAGSVLAALAAGVPLVVVPTDWDKPENARRVVEAGAGLWIPPQRLSPARLRSAVEHVLREPSFKMNAQRLARALRGIDGPAYAADLLEHVCAQDSRSRVAL